MKIRIAMLAAGASTLALALTATMGAVPASAFDNEPCAANALGGGKNCKPRGGTNNSDRMGGGGGAKGGVAKTTTTQGGTDNQAKGIIRIDNELIIVTGKRKGQTPPKPQ